LSACHAPPRFTTRRGERLQIVDEPPAALTDYTGIVGRLLVEGYSRIDPGNAWMGAYGPIRAPGQLCIGKHRT
jgi:hypothetical protein